MNRTVSPVKIQDVQSRSQGPTVVVAVKKGLEGPAATVSKASTADVVAFQIAGDQFYLAGRDLALKTLKNGTPVEYQGRQGHVVGKPLDRRNTFREFVPEICINTALSSAAGLTLGAFFIGSPPIALGVWVTTTLIGAAASVLPALSQSRKTVNFSELQALSK
jgi:hypothetical protein